jgi:hypothetical protein
MAYSGTWEVIERKTDQRTFGTHRLKVPGGWLVRTGCYHFGQLAIAVVFFPDASYSWVIE